MKLNIFEKYLICPVAKYVPGKLIRVVVSLCYFEYRLRT